jgi:hypothetical protein
MAARHFMRRRDQCSIDLDATGIEAHHVGHDGDDTRSRAPFEEPAPRSAQRREQIPCDIVVGGTNGWKSRRRNVSSNRCQISHHRAQRVSRRLSRPPSTFNSRRPPPPPRPRRGRRGRRLCRSTAFRPQPRYVLGSRPFLALHHVELYALSLVQALESAALNGRVVHEQILAAVLGRDDSRSPLSLLNHFTVPLATVSSSLWRYAVFARLHRRGRDIRVNHDAVFRFTVKIGRAIHLHCGTSRFTLFARTRRFVTRHRVRRGDTNLVWLQPNTARFFFF